MVFNECTGGGAHYDITIKQTHNDWCTLEIKGIEFAVFCHKRKDLFLYRHEPDLLGKHN